MPKFAHPSSLADPDATSARTFFEVLCPCLLEMRREAGLRGACAFEVAGPTGGRWVIDFGRGQVSESGTADLTIGMPSDDFTRMLHAELDVDAAYAAGNLSLNGDLARLDDLAILLAPLAA